MIKLVSKVELISQGRNGFEITGVDGLKLSNQNTISDKVIRTRSIPVPFNSRKLFVLLRRPFLIYTKHWISKWDELMHDDNSGIDSGKLAETKIEEWVYARLVSMWDVVDIISIEDTAKGYKVVGSIIMGGKQNKIAALIDPDCEDDIYSDVDELFSKICSEFTDLMTRNILPANPEEIRAIAGEIGNSLETLSDEDMLSKIIELADKRNLTVGFTIEGFEMAMTEYANERGLPPPPPSKANQDEVPADEDEVIPE